MKRQREKENRGPPHPLLQKKKNKKKITLWLPLSTDTCCEHTYIAHTHERLTPVTWSGVPHREKK